MTILEFLQSKSAEEIAERIVNFDEERTDTFEAAFSIGHYDEYFDISQDCPETCHYLETGWNYEDAWVNGTCNLECNGEEGEECPYKIDRGEVLKKLILEWLNSEMEEQV